MSKPKYTYGFVDVPNRGPLDRGEAAFVEAKRREGVPEHQIARMLGVTPDALKRGLIVDEGFASARDPEAVARETRERAEWLTERRERNREARRMTTWRADKPNPLAHAASIPPELRKPTK